MKSALTTVGQLVLLTLEGLRCLLVHKPELGVWTEQLYQLGVKSLSITSITALFTGMVLALQASFALSAFNADMYVGDLVCNSIVRELGPVLTALLVGGRVGAGITAELGAMNITQQLNAMRTMATNPVYKLVVPRVLACTLAVPALTIIADFLGIVGGLLLSYTELHISGNFFLARAVNSLDMEDLISGLGKTFFFGFFIGIIACNNGMRVEGGADGVGRATTNTVVTCSIVILISDFFLTKMFHMLSQI